MSETNPWITAGDATRLLRVSRTTLYAYVSRGRIRSQATSGPTRERQYSRDDVERLRRRTEERRDPDKAAARALQWGVPVLESSIALIDGTRLFYRGQDAVALSRTRSLQEVASLVWSGRFDMPLPQVADAARRRDHREDRRLSFMARAQVHLAQAAALDPHAFDLRPESVAHTGWRILHLIAQAAAPGARRRATVEQTLATAWRLDAASADILRAALILCADHELNVSSFTARCVASAGSNPYAVVTAGLAALEGIRHGGSGARVEAMFEAIRHSRRIATALSDRLRRGDRIDGLGHPLYRGGDPRATALLALLRERHGKSPELAFVLRVADEATALMREHPNVDFALAAVARVLKLPTGAPLALFAIGRTIGWIGQAIEQYATGQLIRPRAKYVGVVPNESAAGG